MEDDSALVLEMEEGMRFRGVAPSPPPSPPPPPVQVRRRVRVRTFEERSESQERLDRDESRMGLYVTIALLCAVFAAVAAKAALLAWAGDPPAEVVPPYKDRFVLVERSNWSEYERERSACVRPTDAEAAVWASTGEACARGDCLDVANLLRIMKALAARDGEAYSTMGRTARNAPLPCACAFRDEDGRVETYLDPREKSRGGDAYAARVEIELFGGRRVEGLEFPGIVEIEHRAWPSGEKVAVVATGAESARWSAAWYVMNL